MPDTAQIERNLGLAKSSALSITTLVDAAKVALNNERPDDAARYAQYIIDVANSLRSDAEDALRLLGVGQ